MPQARKPKKLVPKREISEKNLLISEVFSEVGRAEAVQDKIQSIEASLAEADENVVLAISNLVHEEAFLEALRDQLSELIEGYDEPAALIDLAKSTIKEATEALESAKAQHVKLRSELRALGKDYGIIDQEKS